jgi:YgiT-type zinc finger domain-containing protein
MVSEYTYYCPRCQIGRLHQESATYLRLYRGLLVAAPDTPAHVCDVCGYQEFDQAAMRDILMLTSFDDDDDLDEQPRTKPGASVDASDNTNPPTGKNL